MHYVHGDVKFNLSMKWEYWSNETMQFTLPTLECEEEHLEVGMDLPGKAKRENVNQ